MLEFFSKLFSSDYMAHGHCYFWQPGLIWLHASSDVLIALAYFSLPFSLLYFVRKRPELKLRGLILMFAGFILACGATHAMSVWNVWHSTYRLEGVIKAITAAISIATAIVAVKLTPVALKIASPEELEALNRALIAEVEARKIAEAKLRHMLESQYIASEARLHAYFETASQAIIVTSADLRIRMVNLRTEELFGYPRAEMIGNSIEMLWPERFREEYRERRLSEFTARRGEPAQEKTYLRRNGEEVLAQLALSFVDSEDGPLAFTMLTDLTERRQIAEELARANEHLRSYLEAASQAIVAVAKDGRIVLVNRRTEELFGYSREELLGATLEMLIPARYHHSHVGNRLGFFDDPRLRPMGLGMALAGLRKDGSEFPVEIGLSSVETAEGILALGLISDITERKRAQDELKHAHDEVLRSNTELEQFAYIASHDLQEPLRMVTGYLNLLDRRYRDKLDDEAREFIHFAVDGAARMKGLIQDVLSVSRISRQEVHLTPSSSAVMLTNARINLKIAIEESAAAVTSDELPEVYADGGMLTQVFQNLIGNAIKFRSVAPLTIHVSAKRAGAEWIFSVRDNGIGIDPKHGERIFRIFERLNEPGKYAGSGIGLAITQRIVARHGGRVWVESQPGEGSTFFFSIPVSLNRPTARS